MLGMVRCEVASRCQLYLAAKPSHVGVDVYRIAGLLHCPIVCSHQMRGQGFLSCIAVSCHAVVGGGAFWGMRSPQAWIFDGGLTIWVAMLVNLYME
jgi:hypothetical protein